MKIINNSTYLDFNIDLTPETVSSELLNYVSSVNIPCLAQKIHPKEIKKLIEACEYKDIAFGASIELLDEEQVSVETDELESLVIFQVGALWSFVKAFGCELEHVRPSGQLAKLVNEDPLLAVTIANAVQKVNKWLIYQAPQGDVVATLQAETEMRVVSEIQLGKNTEVSIKRLQAIIQTPDKQGIESIRFDCDAQNSLELIKKACELINPKPPNFNRAEVSGWV